MSKKISDKDKALFDEAMKGINKLKQKNKTSPYKKPVKTPKPSRPFDEDLASQPPQISIPSTMTYTGDSTLSFKRNGLDPKQWQALKKGTLAIDAVHDFHGLKQDMIIPFLCQRLNTAKNNHHRLLLIIHGKGGQKNAYPIVKNTLAYCLPQMQDVLAFHSAMPKDGGTGALYLLLKR